jgi:hypothetical protein
MTRVVTFVAVGCLLMFGGSPAYSQTEARAKDPALQAAIEGRQKAVDARNAAEWEKYTTDNFEFVSAEGVLSSRQERLNGLTTGKGQRQSVVVESIRMLGPDTAVLVQRVGNNRMSLVWSRQSGTWKVAAGHSTPILKK